MNTSTTFGQYLKSLNRFFYAPLAGQILLFLATIFIVESGATGKHESLDIIFKYSLPILGFGLVMAALIFYKIQYRSIKDTDSLMVKLYKFKTAFLIKYCFLNAIVFFSLVACLGTDNYQYMIMLFLAIVIQIMSKPSEGNILARLKLNEEEKSVMLPGDIVAVKEKPLLIRYPVLAVALISFSLYSGYDVILGLIKKQEWTAEEKDQMVHDCIIKAKEAAAKHPEEVKAYCECTNEAIFTKFTHKEIWENNQLSSEELMKTLTPVFAECLRDLKEKIKAKEEGK